MIYEYLFKPINSLTLASPIAAHADFIINNIYKLKYGEKYPSSENNTNEIARYFHGGAHVACATIYVPVLALLYKKHGNIEVNTDDLKLLQIATLFHDSGREGDGDDREVWEYDSAQNCELYLIHVLGIEKDKAERIAATIYTKDKINNDKTILEKLLHDADCVDIIRARPKFFVKEMDFYKDYAANNPDAFHDLIQVVSKVRSLIEYRGDSYDDTNPSIKKIVENADHCFQKLQDLIDDPSNQLGLLNPEQTLDWLAGKYDTELTKKMQQGKLFARGIGAPACIANNKYLNTDKEETMAAVEIRKTYRKKGHATRTNKKNNTEKEGNPNRSVTVLTPGAAVYTPVGHLIYDPDMNDLVSISKKDIDSGRGKKEDLYANQKKHNNKTLASVIRSTQEKVITAANKSIVHTEAIFHIKKFSGIYYTHDRTHYDSQLSPGINRKEPSFKAYQRHPARSILQAIFERTECKKLTGENHPLIYYSFVHNRIEEDETAYTDDKILEMWKSVAIAYLNRDLDSAIDELYKHDFSMDDFKINCITPKIKGTGIKSLGIGRMASADSNYPAELKQKVDEVLAKIVSEKRITLEKMTQEKQITSKPTTQQIKVLGFSKESLDSSQIMILKEQWLSTFQDVNSLKNNLNHYMQISVDGGYELIKKLFTQEERIYFIESLNRMIIDIIDTCGFRLDLAYASINFLKLNLAETLDSNHDLEEVVKKYCSSGMSNKVSKKTYYYVAFNNIFDRNDYITQFWIEIVDELDDLYDSFKSDALNFANTVKKLTRDKLIQLKDVLDYLTPPIDKLQLIYLGIYNILSSPIYGQSKTLLPVGVEEMTTILDANVVDDNFIRQIIESTTWVSSDEILSFFIILQNFLPNKKLSENTVDQLESQFINCIKISKNFGLLGTLKSSYLHELSLLTSSTSDFTHLSCMNLLKNYIKHPMTDTDIARYLNKLPSNNQMKKSIINQMIQLSRDISCDFQDGYIANEKIKNIVDVITEDEVKNKMDDLLDKVSHFLHNGIETKSDIDYLINEITSDSSNANITLFSRELRCASLQGVNELKLLLDEFYLPPDANKFNTSYYLNHQQVNNNFTLFKKNDGFLEKIERLKILVNKASIDLGNYSAGPSI